MSIQVPNGAVDDDGDDGISNGNEGSSSASPPPGSLPPAMNLNHAHCSRMLPPGGLPYGQLNGLGQGSPQVAWFPMVMPSFGGGGVSGQHPYQQFMYPSMPFGCGFPCMPFYPPMSSYPYPPGFGYGGNGSALGGQFGGYPYLGGAYGGSESSSAYYRAQIRLYSYLRQQQEDDEGHSVGNIEVEAEAVRPIPKVVSSVDAIIEQAVAEQPTPRVRSNVEAIIEQAVADQPAPRVRSNVEAIIEQVAKGNFEDRSYFARQKCATVKTEN